MKFGFRSYKLLQSAADAEEVEPSGFHRDALSRCLSRCVAKLNFIYSDYSRCVFMGQNAGALVNLIELANPAK